MIRQLVTESLVLGALGGALGLVIAVWGLSAFEALRPALPRTDTLIVDGRAVAFTSLVALGTALAFGLAPALDAAGTDLRQRLQSTTQSPGRGVRRTRGVLVTAQLALATVLLIAAGLLARSLNAVIDVERGYRTDNVLAITVQAWNYYPELAQRAAFVEQTLARIAALPGVVAAGVTSSLPLAEGIGADVATVSVPDRPPPPPGAGEPTAHTAIVTSGYFESLGIPLVAGRLFGNVDRADAPHVALVNEAFARRHWPGQDPVGRAIALELAGGYAITTTAEIVGVVGDVRHASLEEAPRPSLFLPHAQHPTAALQFTVRTAGDPTALAAAVRAEIHALNAAMPIDAVTTLDGLLGASLRERRFAVSLLATFALTALALAAVGTYGLLSYESSRRAREIGVRVALGAPSTRVVGSVVGDGLKLAALGIGIGALLALAAAPAVSRFLFAVSPFDPATFGGVALLLIGVTVVASVVPANRAARIDPAHVMRAE